MLKHITSLFVLIFLIAINQWLSIRFGFKMNYLQYYIDNGSLIGIITAIVVISWGDINKLVELISPRPYTYLMACLQVAKLPVYVLSDEVNNLNEKWDIIKTGYRSGVVGFKMGDLWMFWDILFGGLLLFPIIVGLFLWLLLVAPLQYFIFLFAGAPARSLGLFSSEMHIALLEKDRLKVERIKRGAKIPEGWWDASFSQKPVAVTAVISSLIYFVVKLVV